MVNLLNNGKRNMGTPGMRRVVTAAFVNTPGSLHTTLKINDLNTLMKISAQSPDGERFIVYLQGTEVCEIRLRGQKHIL